MNRSRLPYLYQQYLSNNYTVDELQEFILLVNDPNNEAELIDLMDGSWINLSNINKQEISEIKAELIYNSVVSHKQSNKSYINLWIGIAAAALLFISITLFFNINAVKRSNSSAIANSQKNTVKEVSPGSNKATLTLVDGKKINLESTKTGLISKIAGVIISKIADGQLIYIPGQTNKNHTTVKAQYNTITTPKGGQFHVILPDGTQVFLNSASSLMYPIEFLGDKRSVALKGEAYFEVAKNAHLPFVVEVNGKQKIEVLGTHFNVEAYADDNVINTTLLEGSVKVVSAQKSIVIKPGQMAVNEANQSLKIEQANLEEVMAWKNGLFVFNNENITSIMKKIARWYNIDVVFKGNLENSNFIGNYSRDKSLTNLLKSIELMDKVHFKIEGRSVTVIGK